MTVFGRRISLGAAALALFTTGQALAQEDLDSGKTAAQLYAANCAICHKTPHGLSKAGGPFGLQGFLREHYTASRQAAAAIAAYVEAVDRGAPPVAPKRTAKPKEAAKPGDAKASKAKAEPKGDSKGESKGEPKSEPKSEAKGSEPAKPQDKPAETKPAETKVDAGKPDAKPDAKPASTPPAESKPDSEKNPN